MDLDEFLVYTNPGGLRKVGSGYLARCPAHDDHNPSLSISQGDDGRILLHCHAGCTLEDICARFNLTVADLMPAKSSDDGNRGCAADNPTHHTDAKTKEQLPIVEVYDYPDADVDYFYAVGRAATNDEGRP